MRLGIVGGGPGGLLTAILVRLADPTADVTVYERNAPDDTFGFGVVFSDETLANLRGADPVVFDRIEAEFRHWPDIDIHYRGRVLTSGGHGFAAIERRRLLAILTERATSLGADVRHRTEVGDVAALAAEHDVLVGADGVRSAVRTAFAEHFRPTVVAGRSKYIWLGTTKVLDRFVFVIAETPHGIVQAHAYPYSDTMSTWIVETDPATWEAFGLGDGNAIAFTKDLFADHLDGYEVVGNNSRWLDFPTVSNETWRHRNVVLLGDAAHTAHFSIGSGTKLAMEDAIALAAALTSGEDDALPRYEAERRAVVASTQRAADTSREWFEGIRRFVGLPPEQFAFQLLTRSQRITYDNLRVRDAAFTAEILEAFWKATPEHIRPADPATPPMFYPYEVRGLRLANRVVVSPMAQYSAVDGLPTDWHLVHLGSRAVGGAGLVMTEMTCVSPEGRITHGCTGLWNDAQRDAWARIVTFVHEQTGAKIGLQLGHSGRKGSCVLPWEGEDDDPLTTPEGAWDVVAPSPLPYRPDSPVPRELSVADLADIAAQFAESARKGAEAGFDLVELHMAHGYLLSSFISPLTNVRTDSYGGSLANRMRFPLEVVAAVRAVWDGPLSVRISATDWAEGGLTGDDAVEVARLLVAGGADVLDVSTGQVVKHARPRYGRLYQTPFADRIRQEVGCPVMTVGAVSSVDDVNTVILAGRADLCLLARPHLVDPYWTLNAAIDQGYEDFPWPVQYLTGKNARRREQQP